MGFRPTLWPTLMAVPMLLVLLGLGSWQVQRLYWKQDLIELRTNRPAAAPVALSEVPEDLAAVEFRRIVLAGTFMHDREMHLAARTHDRRLGYQIVTPLKLDQGGYVLVNRGWVPQEQRDPATRAAGQIAGQVSVEGLIRLPGRKSSFTPDNEPARNYWFFVDVPAMAAFAKITPVHPFVVEAGPASNPGGLPVGGQSKVNLRNFHLQYALTWYGMALGLIVIYVLYHRKLRREEEEGRPPPQ